MDRSRRESDWTLFVCTVTHTFVHLLSFMPMALIPVFMAEFGLSIPESGLLVSIPLVLSVSISLPYGPLTDRISPRKLIAASLLLSGLSGLAVSQANDFLTLLLPLIFGSLSSTLYHPPVLSIVSELLPPTQRSRALGIHGAGGMSGVAIGPITLGLVMEGFGWRFAYLVWVFPILLSSMLILKLPKARTTNHNLEHEADLEKPKDQQPPRTSRYGYIILLIALSIRSVGGQSVSTYMTTYLISNRGLTESMASFIYGLNPFVGIVGALSGGYLADRLGSKRWMVITYLGGTIVLAGVWLGSLWTLVIMYLVGGCFEGSTMGPSSSLAAEFSPKERRGLAYTVFMLSFSSMGAISPVIAAEIIEIHGIQALFPFAICLLLVGALFLQLLPKNEKSSDAGT